MDFSSKVPSPGFVKGRPTFTHLQVPGSVVQLGRVSSSVPSGSETEVASHSSVYTASKTEEPIPVAKGGLRSLSLIVQ